MQSMPRSTLLTFTLASCLLAAGMSPAVMAAGTCREANCGGAGAPKEDKCDRAALDKARADYKKWMKIYQEQNKGADDAEHYANEATDQALEDAEKFYEPMLEKLEDVPKDLVRDDYIEKMIHLTFGEAAAHAFSIASPVKDLADLLIKQANVAAKEITAMQQAGKNANQAEQAAERARESLDKAIEADKKGDALEKACQSKGDPRNKDSESGRAPGQSEMNAARQKVNSWKKVERSYADAGGNFQAEAKALQTSVAVVQGNEGASLHEGFRFIRTGTRDAWPVAETGTALSQQQITRITHSLGLALTKNAVAWKALKKAKAELQKLGGAEGKR
jgi:hypothetical protein